MQTTAKRERDATEPDTAALGVAAIAAANQTLDNNGNVVDASTTCACTRIRGCRVCGKRELYEPVKITSHDPSEVSGLLLLKDALTEEEEALIVKEYDSRPWSLSQSGRRKQDYGPKVNFKSKKAKWDDQCLTIPDFMQPFLRRAVDRIPVLEGFHAAELIALEYTQERGAHFDPHWDDMWAWGPRILGISLLGDVKIVFTKGEDAAVEVCVPRRSFFVMSGESRYVWQHGIPASGVPERRLSMTVRELGEGLIRDFPKVAAKMLPRMLS
eukprot:PhM_4_TR14723/c0_g1_i1/m.78805/K10766/ALKBH4; alkylated DNA repair protein alkB homolog 4